MVGASRSAPVVPCYSPLEAFQLPGGEVVFRELHRHASVRTLQLACGQCIGCRLERSRQWAVRCMHEASMHDENVFVTLTYDDEHFPVHGDLVYRDFQLFMKRVRRFFRARLIRFYAAGEYGEDFSRPHFHALLFGCAFSDRYPWSKSGSGATVYRSPVLETLWTAGFSSCGDVNFESAAYVARYVVKKVTGKGAASHYSVVDAATGECVHERRAEFNKMSLKPGIGFAWLERFVSDVYPSGMCVVNGVESLAPRYYDRIFAKRDPDTWAEVCYRRDRRARSVCSDNTAERLLVKEQVALARAAFLKREL